MLNRPERVSEATQLKVRAAMDELAFVRNEGARQLRMGDSRTLAYVALDAGNPFFADVTRGLEEVAEAAGLAVFLCNAGESADREASYLRLLEQQRVTGVLVTPVDSGSDLLRQLPARGLPVVLVDRPSPDGRHCSVTVDDVGGGRLALDHLLELGHERIAFVGGPMQVPQVADRWHGALAAVEDAGRDPSTLVHLATEGLSVGQGRAAAERLFGMPAKLRPSAVFCANDLVALGVLQRCTELGLDVPGDLAIVGYDDIQFAAGAAVPLTSVRQPAKDLGRTAARLLLSEAHDEDHTHEQVRYDPVLVVRGSTR
ncbi:LacI family DNA-binding transcriptional regulator [Arthrobacter sp. NEB 688]|uniref:LacI family DNA-binding transcriptional regulator n=1 Tax=Arthrobacter sp. NEB 688 TaxID=904039 RepID=UPI002570F9E2|nr:LacI family DNA-binding transcriptional regulator [Arthrobacter sp. NEB 688]